MPPPSSSKRPATRTASAEVPRPALTPGASRSAQHAEALRLDAQRRVELGAEVLERHHRGELHDLPLAEMAAQPREELVGDLLAGDGHALGILQRAPLQARKGAPRARAAPAGSCRRTPLPASPGMH